MSLAKGFFGLLILGGVLVGCERASDGRVSPSPSAEVVQSSAVSPEVAQLQKTGNAVFKPLPAHAGESASSEMVELGRMLYYEKRLSKDGTISCNSCHDLQRYGVDGEPTSLGVGGQRGGRNAPTVYNAALHVAQFWDGRSPDVEDQAAGPMLNPVEMAMEKELVEDRLREIPEYQERFAKVFPDQKEPITLQNTAEAIASFERGLLTPGPFDRFLEGDPTALSADQMAGMKLFVEVGCASCHNGPGLGGSQYQKLGVKKEFETEDMGRFEVTGKESDKKKFKVPSLRNITQTGPYFHDGSVESLHQGVAVMAEYQLDKELTPDEMSKLEAFLSSLTGEIDPAYTKEPKLP